MTNLRRETCGAYKVGSLLPTDFFHMHESEIEPLTTCLRDQDSHMFSILEYGKLKLNILTCKLVH
jgi:hypothetical protein